MKRQEMRCKTCLNGSPYENVARSGSITCKLLPESKEKSGSDHCGSGLWYELVSDTGKWTRLRWGEWERPEEPASGHRPYRIDNVRWIQDAGSEHWRLRICGDAAIEGLVHFSESGEQWCGCIVINVPKKLVFSFYGEVSYVDAWEKAEDWLRHEGVLE